MGEESVSIYVRGIDSVQEPAFFVTHSQCHDDAFEQKAWTFASYSFTVYSRTSVAPLGALYKSAVLASHRKC